MTAPDFTWVCPGCGQEFNGGFPRPFTMAEGINGLNARCPGCGRVAVIYFIMDTQVNAEHYERLDEDDYNGWLERFRAMWRRKYRLAARRRAKNELDISAQQAQWLRQCDPARMGKA